MRVVSPGIGLAVAPAAAMAAGVARGRRKAGGHPCFAFLYDGLARLADQGELGTRRRVLLAAASGRVLELGSGTGENFKRYREGVEVVAAAEPDPYMLRRGRRRTAESRVPVRHLAAVGERLPFAEATFDTVVATLVLCSVDDPEAAAAEMRRVLRPGGQLLVLEHVRAASPALARWQDRLERPWAAVAGGCHPNRDTVAVLARHGFDASGLAGFVLRPSVPVVAPHVQGITRIL